MASPLPTNYEDLSTEKGFQFRFYCELCTAGFTSRFTPLRRAASVGAGDTGEWHSEAAMPDPGAHAVALKRAVGEMERHLRYCKGCEQWVCVRACWNAEEKLCKECAPIPEAEVVREMGEPGQEDPGAEGAARAGGKRESGPRLVECLNCGAMVEDRLFCSECGESLRGANVCPECDADIAAGAKFCSVCGAKLQP